MRYLANNGRPSSDSTEIIGVTIGAGRMDTMAVHAAETFRAQCNLPVAILDDSDMASCNLRYPCWLKFHIFDLLKTENAIYFDADTITAANYFPEKIVNRSSLIAVRDIPGIYSPRDARLLGYRLDKCINSGWFVANRSHHATFFRACQEAARHYDALLFAVNPDVPLFNSEKIFFDQPIFNLLIYRLDLPVLFLDRRHNYIGYEHGNLWSMQTDIFLFHFARGLRYPYGRVAKEGLARRDDESWRVKEDAFETFAGKWRLHTNNTDIGGILFREDGTLCGWNGLNYWFVRASGDLVLSRWENADLQMHFDGTEWRNYEQNSFLRRC